MRPMSGLSPRAARTRTALVAAGFDLLAAKPIDALTIDEVVAAAGVAKGADLILQRINETTRKGKTTDA